MRIANVNSTTAAQPVFMTCPGPANVLSMGNTQRYIIFFSAHKKFTSCHNMAGEKILWFYFVPCVQTYETYVPAYLCTYLHTHTHTFVTAHKPTGTHLIHTYMHTYIHIYIHIYINTPT